MFLSLFLSLLPFLPPSFPPSAVCAGVSVRVCICHSAWCMHGGQSVCPCLPPSFLFYGGYLWIFVCFFPPTVYAGLAVLQASRGSPCLCLSSPNRSASVTDTSATHPAFTRLWGYELRSSRLCKKCFSPMEPSSPNPLLAISTVCQLGIVLYWKIVLPLQVFFLLLCMPGNSWLDARL